MEVLPTTRARDPRRGHYLLRPKVNVTHYYTHKYAVLVTQLVLFQVGKGNTQMWISDASIIGVFLGGYLSCSFTPPCLPLIHVLLSMQSLLLQRLPHPTILSVPCQGTDCVNQAQMQLNLPKTLCSFFYLKT